MDLAAALQRRIARSGRGGCPVIQVEEPRITSPCCTTPPATEKDLDFFTRVQSRSRGAEYGNLGAHLLGKYESAESLLDAPEL